MLLISGAGSRWMLGLLDMREKRRGYVQQVLLLLLLLLGALLLLQFQNLIRSILSTVLVNRDQNTVIIRTGDMG